MQHRLMNKFDSWKSSVIREIILEEPTFTHGAVEQMTFDWAHYYASGTIDEAVRAFLEKYAPHWTNLSAEQKEALQALQTYKVVAEFHLKDSMVTQAINAVLEAFEKELA